MKFLLVAINASYSHTNLAVRSLSEFAKQNPKYQQNNSEVKFVEFTINQPIGEIFRGIACEKPDYIIFSTYIWNSELLCKIIPEMKKLLPNCKIGAGGPEFGFAAKKYLEKLPVLDFIIRGEGELVIDSLVNGKDKVKLESFCNPKITQDNLPCIFYQDHQEYFPLLPDLHYLPFAYPNLESEEVDHKIYYYESSRGCPFNCAYCMSSLEKKVRFMPLERTFKDLQRFMDAGVPLVKFVDRTFNLQPERYIKIWEYLLKNHNRKTMFHFEIEAEFLNKEALDFLQKVPEGLMQFEIGIQSSNKKTLKSINRSENTEDLAKNIRGIPSTIHQHLDLIAGLPFEDLESFGKSFDFVMNLEPDALQLGFLKVLSGTLMEQYAKETVGNGWKILLTKLSAHHT